MLLAAGAERVGHAATYERVQFRGRTPATGRGCPFERRNLHASTRTQGSPAAHRSLMILIGLTPGVRPSPAHLPAWQGRRLRNRWTQPLRMANRAVSIAIRRLVDRGEQPIGDGVMSTHDPWSFVVPETASWASHNTTRSGHVTMDVAPRLYTSATGARPELIKATTAPPHLRVEWVKDYSPGLTPRHREIVGRPTTGVTLITAEALRLRPREYLYRTSSARSVDVENIRAWRNPRR